MEHAQIISKSINKIAIGSNNNDWLHDLYFILATAILRHILFLLSLFFIIDHKKSPKDDVIPNQFEKGVVIAKKHNALWDQLVPK